MTGPAESPPPAPKRPWATHVLIPTLWTPEQARAVVELLDDLREGYRISENYRSDQLASDAKTYTRLMAWLQTVHLLVLDDIGVNKPSEWAVEKLDQIVNFRYANNKPLILTANSLKFSDRIVDRCKEGAVVRLKGPSYRGHLPG